MFTIYILQSAKTKRFYIGHTEDIVKSLPYQFLSNKK